MVVSSWQRTAGESGWVCGGGLARASFWHTSSIWHRWHGENVLPLNTSHHPHYRQQPRLLPAIWLISTPRIQGDNRAVKIQPHVSPRLRGPLCLCCECRQLQVYVNLISGLTDLRCDWVVTGKCSAEESCTCSKYKALLIRWKTLLVQHTASLE